jgi:hypothetical protein
MGGASLKEMPRTKKVVCCGVEQQAQLVHFILREFFAFSGKALQFITTEPSSALARNPQELIGLW